MESGDFFWNSGMFIWRADVILKEVKHSLPELYDHLMSIEPSIGTPLLEQSLDLGVRVDTTWYFHRLRCDGKSVKRLCDTRRLRMERRRFMG